MSLFGASRPETILPGSGTTRTGPGATKIGSGPPRPRAATAPSKFKFAPGEHPDDIELVVQRGRVSVSEEERAKLKEASKEASMEELAGLKPWMKYRDAQRIQGQVAEMGALLCCHAAVCALLVDVLAALGFSSLKDETAYLLGGAALMVHVWCMVLGVGWWFCATFDDSSNIHEH